MISLPRGTEMFHFPRCRPPALFDSGRGRRDRPAGLPHSETHGSRAACASPWNIAACRVLRRHPLPRHPSCARKAWPQNLFARPRLRTSDAPAGSTAPSGRGLPLLHSIYLQSLFLSFASGCQRAPAARRAAGMEIVFPGWWAHLDSNQGPLPYQRSALTN